MSNILITGCRGGIGLAAAVRLLKLGHKVYATVHREDSVPEVKKTVEPFGKNAIVEKLDITIVEDREKAAAWDIDVLINNAGIGDSGPLMEIDVQKIRDVFETNVIAAIELTQLAGKKMMLKGNGRIVIIGSMYGLSPTPFLAPYGMSKFALEDVAFSLRKELQPFGIYVVMVNPGAYDTGFNKKNINKKNKWMNENSLYKNNMGFIKKCDDTLIKLEVQNVDGIAKKVVKAAVANKPKHRYAAPWWQWIMIPFVRKFS